MGFAWELALFLILIIPISSAFDVSPSNPKPGDKITLTGTASPGEIVNLRSSFQMDLPVTGGRYEYATSVEIPQKPNRFTVTARNVKDLNAGVKIVIWITKRFQSQGGVATVSQADVPPGRYNLKMFGDASDGASTVPVKVEAETGIKADSTGSYSLVIDTSGIPAGDYIIEGSGDSKTIRIGSASAIPSARYSDSGSENSGGGGESSSDTSYSYTTESPKSVSITPEIIRWYAAKTGLDPDDPDKYAEAEKNLRNRLKGGYWLVIARGSPMTEEAGNCGENYCLVRGIDACTTCREKDILTKSQSISSKPQRDFDANATKENQNQTSPETSSSEPLSPGSPDQTVPGQSSLSQEKKGYIDGLLQWILQLIWGWIK